MRSCLIGFFFVLVLAAAALWFGGGWLLDSGTRSQLPRVEKLASRESVAISRLGFEKVTPSPWPVGARWSGWSGTARIRETRSTQVRELPVSARSLTVVVEDWSPLSARVRLDGLEIGAGLDPDLPGEELPFNTGDSGVEIGRVSEGFAEVPGIPVIADPAATAADLAASLRELFTDGSTARSVSLGARVHLRIRGLDLSGRLLTERIAGRTTLRLDRGDVEEMAARYERPLTAAEKTILSEYPLRAISLLRIKEYSERLSAALHRNDPAYGVDFSRHVIWSYWLARVFGDEFATRVTDAHEEGETGNTAAERAQDLANNAVGRRYAMAGISESQALKSIRSDPSIVREPK